MLSAFFRGWVEVVEYYSTKKKNNKPITNQKQPTKKPAGRVFDDVLTIRVLADSI